MEKNGTAKSLIDTWIESQKKMVDMVAENAQKFTPKPVTETVEKSADQYKNWLDGQMAFFNNSAEKVKNTTESTFEKTNHQFTNWMNSQMDAYKRMSDAGNMWNNFSNFGSTGFSNPFAANMPEEWKKGFEAYTSYFSNWNKNIASLQQEMTKNFQGNGNAADAFKGFFSNAANFAKFTEMWLPMWKSIQDKTFTVESFKAAFSPEKLKSYVDNIFQYAPEQVRNMYQNAVNQGSEAFAKFNEMNGNSYQQAMGNWKNMMSAMPSGHETFANLNNSYSQMAQSMQQMFAPAMKMMSPGANKDQMEKWALISDKMAKYNLKQAEMQYMMYVTGAKAMEKTAEMVANKLQKSEGIADMKALYTEYLNLNDKVYVEFFESNEYAAIMAEVNTLNMQLKKEVELQMEKAFAHLPLVPRSEMDELYLTVYELKKEVKNLRRELDKVSTVAAPKAESKVAETKAADTSTTNTAKAKTTKA